MSKHQTLATVGEPSDFSGLNHLDCGKPLDFGVTIGLLSHVVSHIHAKFKTSVSVTSEEIYRFLIFCLHVGVPCL